MLASIKRNTTGVNDWGGNDFKRYWYEMEKGIKRKERLNDRFFLIAFESIVKFIKKKKKKKKKERKKKKKCERRKKI